MWIEIPKKCEARDCNENATHFFNRRTWFGSHWGFFCKSHAVDADAGYFVHNPNRNMF